MTLARPADALRLSFRATPSLSRGKRGTCSSPPAAFTINCSVRRPSGIIAPAVSVSPYTAEDRRTHSEICNRLRAVFGFYQESSVV